MFWNQKRITRGRQYAHPRRRFGFEQFEARRMMAVTAAAGAFGGMDITGDSASDDIAVVGTANPGEFTVTGRNGTTVNGTANGSATISGVRSGMMIDLGDGQNILQIDNVYLAGEMDITTGAGDDSITLGASGVVSTVDNLLIDTGAGNDVLREENYHVLINRSHVVNMGDGADSVTAVGASTNAGYRVDLGTGDNSFLGNGLTATDQLAIIAGPHPQQAPEVGGNSIALFFSSAQYLLAQTGNAGTNHLYFDTVFSQFDFRIFTSILNTSPVIVNVARNLNRSLSIFTGAGDDQINLYGNQFAIHLTAGGGSDTVDLRYNVLPGFARAMLEADDDTLIADGNWAPEPSQVSFDGGPGGNRLVLTNNLFPQLSTTNFVSG